MTGRNAGTGQVTESDCTDDVLAQWMKAVCQELGIEPDDVVRKTVLSLARVVAHRIDRPAAPLTAYFLGAAVGQGQELTSTADRVQELVRRWPEAE